LHLDLSLLPRLGLCSLRSFQRLLQFVYSLSLGGNISVCGFQLCLAVLFFVDESVAFGFDVGKSCFDLIV
jgi:hypothetical protein